MALSSQQLNFVNFVEQRFYLSESGTIPSAFECASELGLSEQTAKKYYSDPDITGALERRGIDLGDHLHHLSPEQLVACQLALSTTDTRSLRKKLDEAGIKASQWDAWKKLPKVQKYLRIRAEEGLGTAIATAEVALAKNAESGDLNSIKYLMEMTGRWSSKTVGELNVNFLLMKILEILQTHITDPVMLQSISEDLLSLAGGPVAPVAIEAPRTNSVLTLLGKA